MKTVSGYLGLFQPPLLDHKLHNSIYCITGNDHRDLAIIPLVPNFFEDAFLAARKSCYQNIELFLPALDMIFVSDAFLLFYEVHTKLQKKMNIYCSNLPQLVVTDEFTSYIHRVEEGSVVFGEWNQSTDLNPVGHFPMTIEFPNMFRPTTRSASDILVSTEDKRCLFCVYANMEKLKYLNSDEMEDKFDEIHIPFTKNLYGGLKYFEVRRNVSGRLLPKLRAYGFQTVEEAELCSSTGGHLGEVKLNGFI